jgi:hypothetical protein
MGGRGQRRRQSAAAPAIASPNGPRPTAPTPVAHRPRPRPSYPPFVKGVIDQGLAAGVEWGRYALKLVLAGEVFSGPAPRRPATGQREG